MDVSSALDFSLYRLGCQEKRASIAEQAVNILRQHGYLKLKNHGISLDTVHQIWYWGHTFFHLPTEEKEKVLHTPGRTLQRGFSSAGSEITSNLRVDDTTSRRIDDRLDQKEHFDCGPPGDTEYPNRWPDLPGFREFMEEHYTNCQQTALDILAMVELGLKLRAGYLTDLCKKSASELRIVHYAPIEPSDELPSTYKRAWPHSDLGVLTLLFQDSVSGLEFEDRNNEGAFVPIDFGAADELLINVSDTLKRWTNDFLRPGIHQVSLPPRSTKQAVIPERMSSAFFLKASRHVSVGPLPAFVTAENPATYDNITALEYQVGMTQILGSKQN